MSSFIGTWKGVIGNPFVGFGGVTKETRIALPLLCLLVLVAASTALMLPIMASEEYIGATARVQIAELARRGISLDEAQLEAARASMASPTVRLITILSALGGGLLSYIAVLLVMALIMKALALAARASVPYKLLFRILVFAGIVTVAGSLVRAGITLAGDWRSALKRVQSAQELKMALQSSLSLALFLSPSSLGKIGFQIVDGATDVFNWIYYVFVYAGLKAAAGLSRRQALTVAVVSGLLSLAIGVGLALLF